MNILDYKNYLLVCAHFDDEGGCSYLIREAMRKGGEVSVVYITTSDAQGISDTRKGEATEALDLIGIPESNRFFLDIPERQEFQNFAYIVKESQKIAEMKGADCVLSPDYEGGHEAHDTAAFCASMLSQRMDVDHFTFPLYHMENGERSLVREFIATRKNIIRLEVSEPEIKDKMTTIYKSQKLSQDKLGDPNKRWEILSRELFYKVNPPFDFTKRPWKEVAYENHPTPYFTFEDFLEAVQKYVREIEE
jgi:LmbE family N-acetylglucosaminyl deacetylase